MSTLNRIQQRPAGALIERVDFGGDFSRGGVQTISLPTMCGHFPASMVWSAFSVALVFVVSAAAKASSSSCACLASAVAASVGACSIQCVSPEAIP